MAKENEITEGFKGMDFSGDSKLFNEMPSYKSRTTKKRNLNKSKQINDSVHKSPVEETKRIKDIDIQSTIDELNQYLNGYVTEKGLVESLQGLLNKLNK